MSHCTTYYGFSAVSAAPVAHHYQNNFHHLSLPLIKHIKYYTNYFILFYFQTIHHL